MGFATSKKATDMTDAFAPAIAALQGDLRELERKAREIKSTINVLCTHAGVAEMYPNLGSPDGSVPVTGIKADTFYGKTQATAAREYLDMRKASNQGPATPREIYEALVQGGFQFETNVEANRMVGLRSNLRKNSKTFHRLPNGQYGLLAWYPNAKSSRPSVSGGDDDELDTKTAADTESAADHPSSEAPFNVQEGGASEPPTEED